MKNVCDFTGAVPLLEALEDDTFRCLGYTSRPTGTDYIKAVLQIAQGALFRGAYKSITPEDLEQLTEDNYHTARRAAQILLDLEKYAGE